MGLVEPDFRDRVRYTLRHNPYGTLVITEPEGWRSDEMEIARHKDYHGMFTQFSNSLKFHLDAADYIRIVKKLYGVNANIELIKEERDPDTDVWERSYSGFLDLSTLEINEGVVSVKFNSSGIQEQLKARENQKIEIERTDTIDGGDIDPIETNIVELDGRSIFLRTTFDENITNDEAHMSVESNAGNTRNQTVGYPLELVDRSHVNAHSVIPDTRGTEDFGSAGMMFFAVSDRDRYLRLSFKFNTNLFVQQYENIQWAFYKIQLVLYENGTDYSDPYRLTLYDLGENHPWFGDSFDLPMPQFTQNAEVEMEIGVTLLEGWSMSIEGYGKADMFVDNNAGMRVQANDIQIDYFTITEESFTEASASKFVLAHDLGSHLAWIITGNKNAFYSEILGRTTMGYDENGEASLTGMAHGHWVRQFDKLPEDEENKYKHFTTTFKHFRESMFATWGLGIGVEAVGYRERIRMEPLSYFYNRNVTVRLPNQVGKVKRTIAKEYYYSGIEVGFTKGGEYEEAMGLDEYNTQTTYTTIITRVTNLFRAISQYRGDSYGKEFARRQPMSSDPTKDTSYDKDVFIMDLKKVGSVYKERLWADDFAEEPSGVFSPETATNLRYSPFNLMKYRHAWNIASGVFEYPYDFIRYGSSVANSKLKTRLTGEPAFYENIPDGLQNNALGRSRFIPEYIEFEHVVDSTLMKQIQGKTVILGKEILNVYGLFEFINEDNEKELAYLISLKPNKKGKWKMLKAQYKRDTT